MKQVTLFIEEIAQNVYKLTSKPGYIMDSGTYHYLCEYFEERRLGDVRLYEDDFPKLLKNGFILRMI